jgi:SpoVK/Ycf46/Vps4 family AAA+-type ATPase
MNADARITNEQLWGLRPVRWGLRMFGTNGNSLAENLALGISSKERREVLDFLGLNVPAGDADKLAERLLEAVAERTQVIADAQDGDCVLYRNLDHLQRAFGLSDVDIDILALCAMLQLHPGCEMLFSEYFDRCSEFSFRRKLAQLFDVPDATIQAALAPSGSLVGKGLLNVGHGAKCDVEDRLSLLHGLATALVGAPRSAVELLATSLPTVREAKLDLSAYPHLSREIALLRDRISRGIEQRAQGVNVLLHGAPGTGKSELAASLAQALGKRLYVANSARSRDSVSITPRIRMREVAQLQRLVETFGGGLVLVDEAEDLFPTPWSDLEKVSTKAFVNECLEANPAPTIWISNRIEHMDEAFLRRFDLVIHVPPLPSRAKQKLLRESLPPHTLEERELRRYADRRELSPAMIARLAMVATSGASNDPQTVRDNLHILSSHYLRTLGATPLPAASASASLEHDPDLLNTDPPLAAVFDAMAGSRCGARMLLHGLPGTGKTALGKALAERLDKPLLQRQASSLLSMWVGGTERNLCEMFEEARREDGVLLLDEADSFLRHREQARASWEVTQVNELLTQIEAFDGIFICTTNRLDDLDPAALRRFDFKVAFKPLRLEQRLHLVRKCCAVFGLDDCADDEALQARLRALEDLTPGDAAAALRRLRIAGVATLDALLVALADECRYKPAAHAPMGFVH